MRTILKIDDEWIKEDRSNAGLTPAWIHLRNGDDCYPDDEWIDNPVIIIGWWLHSLAELFSDREGQGMNFMEGPFFVDLVPYGDDFLLISEDKKISWVVNKLDLVNEVMRVANEMSGALISEGLNELAENLDEGVRIVKSALCKASR